LGDAFLNEDTWGQRDEEKIKLQREVEDLRKDLARIRIFVPDLKNLDKKEAENKLKEKTWSLK